MKHQVVVEFTIEERIGSCTVEIPEFGILLRMGSRTAVSKSLHQVLQMHCFDRLRERDALDSQERDRLNEIVDGPQAMFREKDGDAPL